MFMCIICTQVQIYPGANLHPKFKLVPGVYFWPFERHFKNLHPGTKFAPTFEVVQICTRPSAICAYERKMFYFYTFRSGILIYNWLFLLWICINRYEKKKKLYIFYQTENRAFFFFVFFLFGQIKHQNKCA